MKELKEVLLTFKGGLDLSAPEDIVDGDVITEGSNMLCTKGHLSLVPAENLWTTTDFGAVTSMTMWKRYYGSTPLTFAVMEKSVYVKTAGTGTLTAAKVLTAVPTQRCNTAGVADDFLIASGHSNVVVRYDGSAWTDLAGATDFKPRYITYFFSRVIIADMVDTGVTCRYRVRFSEVGSLTTWTGGTTGFVDLVEDLDYFTGLEVLGDRLYLFRENSIWEISHVGGDKTFAYNKIVSGIGCIAPDSIANCGDSLTFMGRNNIYKLSLSGVEPLGDKIALNLMGTRPIQGIDVDLNSDFYANAYDLTKAVGAYLKTSEVYVVLFPRISSAYAVKDKLFYYDFKHKTWSVGTCLDIYLVWPHSFIASERYDATNTYTNYKLAGAEDILIGFKKAVGANHAYVLAWNNHYFTQTYHKGSTDSWVSATTNLIGVAVTKKMVFPSLTRISEIVVEHTGFAYISYWSDEGIQEVVLGSVPPTSVGDANMDTRMLNISRIPCNFTCQSIQLKIQLYAGTAPNGSYTTGLYDYQVRNIRIRYVARKGSV